MNGWDPAVLQRFREDPLVSSFHGALDDKGSLIAIQPFEERAVLEVPAHGRLGEAQSLGEHTAIVPEDRWDEYGPGAVGVGWDQGLLGLTLHLRGEREAVGDPIAWQMSAEGREFATRSSAAWGEANVAAGADPDVAARAVRNTTMFYAPDPEAVP